MADKSVATSVDVLSAQERKLVVEALTLLRKSRERAASTASDKGLDEIVAAYLLSVSFIDALVSKFR